MTTPKPRTAAQRRAVIIKARKDKALAQERARKADLVARGLCRQCGKRRGLGSSPSRCKRCLGKDRTRQRATQQTKPWRPGGPGRRPVSYRDAFGQMTERLIEENRGDDRSLVP